jgi:tripartite ATP-independent transporter DctM subunit
VVSVASLTFTVLVFLVALLLPIFLGIPLIYAIGLSSLILMLSPLGPPLNMEIMAVRMLRSSTNFILLAIPFYLFAGRLLTESGAVDAIFDFSQELVGPIRGGMAHVNVIASLLFSGMSGSAVADAAGLGTVEYEMMDKAGYDDGFSTAVIGSSAIIGPIIPPSIPLIIYGVLAEVSIGDLFLGGIFPGIMMSSSLMIAISIAAARRNYPTSDTWDLRAIGRTFIRSVPAVMTIFLIIGGIVTGVFTATEAGAVAVIWALLVGVFVYGDLDLETFWEVTYESAVDVGELLVILASAAIYAFVVTAAGLPGLLVEVLVGAGVGSAATLLLIVIALLFLGMVLDPITNLILVVPVIAPSFVQLGIDPLHAGVVIVLTLMLGLLTPPFGAVLFVLEKVTDVSIENIARAIVPFYAPLLVIIILLILFPALVTFIPSL